jgi:hypothetical protein
MCWQNIKKPIADTEQENSGNTSNNNSQTEHIGKA